MKVINILLAIFAILFFIAGIVLYSPHQEEQTLPKSPPGIGSAFIPIELKDTTGANVKINSTNGKYLLLDFWASWCVPCREELPALKKLYSEFSDTAFAKADGFEICSVSLDDNRNDWIKAIRKDQPNWHYQLSDLKGWNSPVARQYGIRFIPASFLISPEGKIIRTNLSPGTLRQELIELL